jgi:hypothetical protein
MNELTNETATRARNGQKKGQSILILVHILWREASTSCQFRATLLAGMARTNSVPLRVGILHSGLNVRYLGDRSLQRDLMRVSGDLFDRTQRLIQAVQLREPVQDSDACLNETRIRFDRSV